MVEKTYHDEMLRAFSDLLNKLPETWPKEDKEFVFEEVGHGEYGDALENLIALGFQDDRGFSSVDSRNIQELAKSMGLKDSPLLTRLEEIHGKS